MFQNLIQSFKSSIQRLQDNPQLWYTIFVAGLIFVAFIFIADRFVTIAQDAQDRLVNVRLGALQDSFVEFAPNHLEDEEGTETLNNAILKLSINNSTIIDFKVVKFNEIGNPVIVAAINQGQLGQIDEEQSHRLAYDLSKTDPSTSFTLEVNEGEERLYTTTRTIVDQFDRPIGAVLTKQSLSEADTKITENINNSIIIFVIIVTLVMFLFFRHARIVDYTHLYKKLQEVDNLKDDFISMASHELRTPLTVIRGYAEEISEATEMNNDVKQSVGRIDIAAKQLDNLVADMLDVSRIEQGRMKMEIEKIDPLSVIKEVNETYQKVSHDKGLELSVVNNLSGPYRISADPNRLKQIMVNLVGNAIKYTPSGKVEIKISKQNDDVEIRVSDTGLGMSAEDQKNLFQKFYRVKTDTTSKIRGTGLGLWITKQIIEIMKGQILVESIKGKGSDFIVKFPIEE